MTTLELLKTEGLVSDLSKTNLTIADNVTTEEYITLGRQIHDLGNSGLWWLADWAAWGVTHLTGGDLTPVEDGCRGYTVLKTFAEAHNINYGTIRNLSRIAQEFELSRRRDNLTFNHHVEVASLPVMEQEKWLNRTEKEHLSCRDLRKLIRTAKADFAPEETQGKAPSFLAVEKTLIELDIFFERNDEEIRGSADYLWDVASPGIERMAKIWPDRIKIL